MQAQLRTGDGVVLSCERPILPRGAASGERPVVRAARPEDARRPVGGCLMKFRPLRSRRVFEDIIDQIRGELLAGSLNPGDKLPAERELAEQFEVSRTAVREALRTLEVSGAIELRKGARGGAFIREADPSAIAQSMGDYLRLGHITLEHLTEARRWIESLVVEIACERATAEDFALLEENVRIGERLLEAGRLREKVDVNIEFHVILARATKNPVLILNVELIMDLTRHFAHMAEPDTAPYHLEWRRRLLDLIRRGDRPAAVAAMEERLLSLDARYRRLAAEKAAAGEPAAI